MVRGKIKYFLFSGRERSAVQRVGNGPCGVRIHGRFSPMEINVQTEHCLTKSKKVFEHQRIDALYNMRYEMHPQSSVYDNKPSHL